MMNAVNNIASALAAAAGKSDGGLIKATVVRGPSGEGVFTLRLSGGREVGVQVQTEGGGAPLEPGQKVLLSPSDGKIFIPAAETDGAEQPTQSQQWAQSQQPSQMRQAAQMLLQQVQGGGEDQFISGKQQAEAAEADGGGGGADGAKSAAGASAAGQDGLAKIVGFKVVSEGEAHADGIYRADAAGRILEGPSDGEAPIKDFAAVRLSTVNGQQVVTALTGDGLSAALEELRGGFESPLLRALPIELLKDIFNERGFIDTDTLKALDAALVNRSLSIDPSSPFQMERIGQWLRIALDNPGMAQELADRIPALGAKDAAGLLALIGRLSSGASPESFFATEGTIPQPGANAGGADLLQSLMKAAFSTAPDALLNLVKRIDASSVSLGARLPPAEAARIAREITNALPAQAAAKPGSLHDAGQMSPHVLETNAAPASKTQSSAAAVPQIRAGYSELTETTVRALLGGNGRADAAAVGEKINALREAVARMPAAPSGQGNNTAAGNGGVNGGRTESNAAETNTQSVVSKLSAPTGGNNANAVKAAEAFPHVNAQLAVHRASTPSGGINANAAGGGNAKPTDSFPAVNRGFAPPLPPAQTGGAASVINANNANTNRVSAVGINGINANAADNQNMRGNVGINNSLGMIDNSRNVNNSGNVGINTNGNIKPADNSVGIGINTNGTAKPVNNAAGVGINANVNVKPADNSVGIGINTNSNVKPADSPAGMGINTRGVNVFGTNPVDNQNIRGDVGISNRQGAVDNSRGVNTSNINPADSQNIRVAGNSGGIRINATYAPPVDVPAIKEKCLSIVDTLKSSAAPILREFAQRGEIGAGGGASLIGLVREAVSSLDAELRPLVRGERPLPPEFYERVVSGAGHRISAEAKNALFSQIGSAQVLIRAAMEAADGTDTRTHTFVNIGGNTNANVGANARFNFGVSQGVNNNANFTPTITPSVINNANAAHNVNANINPTVAAASGINNNINPTVNTSINTTVNTNAAHGGNPNINTVPSANVNSNANADITPTVNSNAGTNVNTDNTNANVNPNANPNAAAKADSRPDDFLRIARRIWANTEKLRAGFREAFSTLDLQNRASPLDKPDDGSAAGTVRRSADTLRTEMLLDVSRALRDVFSSVDELQEIVSQLSSGQKALPDAGAALLRAIQALEHQARQSGADVMERLKDVLRELNRLQADAARAQEQGSAAAMRSSPAEAIRSAALTAARSLENLQLLSTQTRTAESEQHLLALPAKIGGEWTEVQIKFVKERKVEKGENKNGHVSIYLNVAPSALGQVTAHLDYHPPNLKLAFQFEKPEVTRWFRQRSAELKEALSQVGLPGTELEFHNKRPIRSESAVAARQQTSIDSGGADEAEGFEVKNGRVDFKI